ncbi:MAG: PAS domain-containing sensor histidine kinase [Candidatus Heimdallarchaeota archaeon]
MSDKPTLSSFEHFFDVTPQAIIIVQDFHNVVYCNKTFMDMTGYTLNDLEPLSMLDLTHDDDKHIIEERIRVRKSGVDPPRNFQLRFVNKDGSISLANIYTEAITFNGVPSRILLGVNISAEPLIDQSPELVTSLIDTLSHHSELGYWVDDINDHTIFINDRLCEYLGYSMEEIRKGTVSDFLHPDSQEVYLQITKKRREGKKTASSYELILINKNGRPNTFSVVGSLLYDRYQNPIGSVGFFSNIEPTKKLSLVITTLNKYALFSRYKDLSSFWKNVLEDIINLYYSECGMVFLDGEVVAEQGEFTANMSPQEILEDMTKSGDLVKHFQEDCSKYHASAQSLLIATLHLNQRPAGFIFICSSIPKLFLRADVDLFLTFCNQITLNYEHHFLYLQSEEEREFVSVLLDILSHDFLNANTSVHGYLELIEQSLDTEDLERFKEYVVRSLSVVGRSERILQTVQQLSKIQQERKARRSIAVFSSLENAIELQKALYHPRIVNVNIDCPKKLYVIAGDLLQNVFENILNNAIKYTPEEREVKIEVSCKPVILDEENFVELRFIDHGIGIPDEIKPSFFKRLSRGDHRFQEGTGLGLYLARVIISSYNGNIVFENRVSDDHSQGTIVVIRLPEG